MYYLLNKAITSLKWLNPIIKIILSWNWAFIISAITFIFMIRTFQKANRISGKVYYSILEGNILQVYLANVNNKSGKFFYSGIECTKHRFIFSVFHKRIENKELSQYNIGSIQIVKPGDAMEMIKLDSKELNKKYSVKYDFYRIAVKNLAGKEFKSKWIKFER